MKSAEKKKLEELFHSKYLEFLKTQKNAIEELMKTEENNQWFSKLNEMRTGTGPLKWADFVASVWTSYLESIGCCRISKNCKKRTSQRVRIEDPIWSGDQIVVPKDLALKILVLGTMP